MGLFALARIDSGHFWEPQAALSDAVSRLHDEGALSLVLCLCHSPSELAVTRPLLIEPAGPHLDQALQLLYQWLPSQERQAAIETFLKQLSLGKVSADLLLVARRGADLEAVVLAVPHQRLTAFVFPPILAGDTAAPLAVPLLKDLTGRLATAGFTLAQCVRDVTDQRGARWLVDAGFSEQARMVELEHDLTNIDGRLPPKVLEGNWSPWQPCDQARFARVVEQTLIGTLDCPEVTGFRNGAEILESHAQSGDSGSSLWWLHALEREGKSTDVGVLLMTEHRSDRTLEVLYMGVVPSHRGQRIGRRLMKAALSAAAERGAVRVRLHASAANHYAIKTYTDSGFVEVGASVLHLWTGGAEK